jgi:hypothetical protein
VDFDFFPKEKFPMIFNDVPIYTCQTSKNEKNEPALISSPFRQLRLLKRNRPRIYIMESHKDNTEN